MEFFIFLCFMSFVSFAVAFLAYGLVIRFLGTEGPASRYGQIILVPLAIIGYDFITMDRTGGIPLCGWRYAHAAFGLDAALLPFRQGRQYG